MHVITKYLLVIQLLLLKIALCNVIKSDVQYLANNFFENLGKDIFLKNEELDDFAAKKFIDTQTTNFISLMRKSLSEPKRTRRSANEQHFDSIGVYKLKEFRERLNVVGNSPKNIVLFQNQYKNDESWYMAVLEEKDSSTELSIYNLNNYTPELIHQVYVANKTDVKLAVLSVSELTYFVLIESNLEDVFIENNLGVFKFTEEKELVKVQNLQKAKDLTLWEHDGEVYMAILGIEDEITHEINISVYQWLGTYFDNIDNFIAHGSQKITPFSIGSSQYLALANYQNELNDTKTYSEIYKFNLNLKVFELEQKILTNAAVDVKYFSFKRDNQEENFVVFANHFEIDVEGNKIYATGSIIYKYMDGYFIPFQNIILDGALAWLPVSGLNGEFLLMASCEYQGIKVFQYNGWQFSESNVEYSNDAFISGVSKISHYLVKDEPVVVVITKNDDNTMCNIFQPIFSHENMLNRFQNEMLSWCEEKLKVAESYNLDVTGKTPEDLEWKRRVYEDFNRTKRSSENVNLEADQSTVVELKDNVGRYLKKMEEIDNSIQGSLKKSENVTFQNLYVDEILINNQLQYFRSIETDKLNVTDVSDFLANTLNIDHGFAIQDLSFENITVENNFSPKSIIWRNFNESKIRQIIVNGSAVFRNNLYIDGLLNGISLNSKNVLLKRGNQFFDKLKADSLEVDTMKAKVINGAHRIQFDMSSSKPFTFESLNISDLVLHGLINQVDIPSLDSHSLKIYGNQTLQVPITFEYIKANNVEAKTISDKRVPEDLFFIHEGQYSFKKHAYFTANFSAKKMYVTRSLNDINVIDGQLAMLMADVDYVQHVNSSIEFDKLEFINNINLTGPINNILTDDFSPVKEINETLLLEGDYFINGGVKIKEVIEITDMVASQTNLTIKRLQEKGLKISESTIPVHLRFLQELNIHELYADKINDVDLRSLIVTGTNAQQVVSGHKWFHKNITITGSTEVFYANSINFHDYNFGILTIHGNQEMRGKIHFENIIANRISNIKTKFQDKMWNDVITTDGKQYIPGTTIIEGSAKFDELETRWLFADSFINGYNFAKIMKDTVFRNTSTEIEQLNFVDLEIQNIFLKDLNFNHLSELAQGKVIFAIEDSMGFPENISVENISFSRSFNDIPADKFGYQLANHQKQDVMSAQSFKKLVIKGQVFISDNRINEIQLDDLENNTVKIDEPFHFHSVTFLKDVDSVKEVQLDGLFESIDLNDIVQSNFQTEQVFNDKISFQENVNVSGKVSSDGYVSGFNLNQLCNFVYGDASRPLRNLVVEGNVYFSKGPKVHYFNKHLVSYILNNTWFTDEEALISGELDFEEMNFKDDLVVEGLLDNVNFEQTARTYFSKTRDQVVSGNFSFQDDVTFQNGVTAQKALVAKEVGTINLQEFIRTVILNNFNQVFEMRVYFDTCEILGVSGDYLVNTFNLTTDVLRYDKFNMVTGKKKIRNVSTYEIRTDKPTNIQNIDIAKWLGSCVLRNGTFHVPGKVKLLGDTKFLGELNTKCQVNNTTFDRNNVMLKSGDQVINGSKVFSRSPVKFTTVKLIGLLNGIDVDDLIYYQVYKNTEIVFNSPIEIDAEIKAKNVNIKKKYKGINVDQFISNLTKPSTSSNERNNYQHLLNSVLTIKESLKDQAFFLDYLEKQEKYMMYSYVYPLIFNGSNEQNLATIYMDDQSYSIMFQVWDPKLLQFNTVPGLQSITVQKELVYVKQITFNGSNCWYMEHKVNSESDQFEGGIYYISKNKIVEMSPTFLHNGTKSVTAFKIPDQQEECLLALFEVETNLFCGKTNGGQLLEHKRIINQPNGIKALSTVLRGIPYIFILSEGNENEKPTVTIWQYNTTSKEFDNIQIIEISTAKDISTISFQGVQYLAITSAYVPSADCAESALLEIRKFDMASNAFITIQELRINHALQLEFAELPSKELVLYVLTSLSQDPLLLYMYEGVSGFTKKHAVLMKSPIYDTVGIKSVTTPNNDHFVIIKSETEIWILHAIFKGQKYE